MKVIFLIFLWLFVSCAGKSAYTRSSLYAPCPSKAYMIVKFCNLKFAYSDRLQHKSKVKITDPITGRSLIIAVRHSKSVRGICLPKRLKRVFKGKERFRAVVQTVRCGDNNVRKCPRYITGKASWYGPKFHGRRTASGVRYNMHDLVAAHRTLPLGTVLLVRNLKNGKAVRVKVLDRGPYVRGRNLDLSYGAAKRLGMLKDGVIPYRAKVLRCGS